MRPVDLRDPRLWLSLFSGLGVIWLAGRDLRGARSPGRLAAPHQALPELAAADGCSACHGGDGIDMTAACLECHGEIDRQLGAQEGLHGSLREGVVRACALCHSDHHGEEFALVGDRSFIIAGAPTPDDFFHGFVGFEMGGAHQELDCEECHVHAWEPELEEGEHRFIGLSQDCATCHEDPHGVPLDRDCAACHGQEAFDRLDPFEHDAAFPLEGAHRTDSCLVCHPKEQEHAIEVLAARGGDPLSPRGCVDCHDDPHSSTFHAGLAGKDCAACHDARDEDFGDRQVAESLSVRDHAASGFALDGPHGEVSCERCHPAEEESFELRFPGRAADDCASCHDSPHGEQFEERSCLDCHLSTAFEPHTFDVESHAQAALPLEGAHAELQCAACHGDPAPGQPRTFAGTPSRCEQCHADAHQGRFDARLEGASTPAGTCAVCHGAQSFKILPQPFDHGLWTGLPLRDAHALAACSVCHGSARPHEEPQRSFGFAPRNAQSCIDCHADPHRGRLSEDCSSCHGEASWRFLEASFDHALTGFRLSASHALAECSDCHAPQPADATGRTFAPALGTRCADCHDDPHGAQFAREGVTECTRCHQSSVSFSELTFDHDRDTRFALDAAHAPLDCSACHRPGANTDVVRYRPLGIECADCHGKPAGGGGRK